MNVPRYKFWLVIGSLLGLLAVVFGAFGAHALELRLEKGHSSASDVHDLLATWDVAARYQMYHALALLAVGLLAVRRCGLAIHLAGSAMTLGTLIFSGCLYALVLTGEKWLGKIVPIGGLMMIVGWICLLIAAMLHSEPPATGQAR
jgi:uncharacterized membrane protein YgdD (TMEM256/DUF423 family)